MRAPRRLSAPLGALNVQHRVATPAGSNEQQQADRQTDRQARRKFPAPASRSVGRLAPNCRDSFRVEDRKQEQTNVMISINEDIETFVVYLSGCSQQARSTLLWSQRRHTRTSRVCERRIRQLEPKKCSLSQFARFAGRAAVAARSIEQRFAEASASASMGPLCPSRASAFVGLAELRAIECWPPSAPAIHLNQWAQVNGRRTAATLELCCFIQFVRFSRSD